MFYVHSPIKIPSTLNFLISNRWTLNPIQFNKVQLCFLCKNQLYKKNRMHIVLTIKCDIWTASKTFRLCVFTWSKSLFLETAKEVWTDGLKEPIWRSLWSMGRILTNVNQSYRRSTRPFHSSNFAGCRCSLIPRLSHTTARYEFFEYALFHQSNISNQLSSLACCIVCGRLVLTRNSTGLRTAKQRENSI